MRAHHSSNEPARSGTASSLDGDVREPGVARAARPARSASSSENGPGMPGGGTGAPSCALTASKHDAEPRVALARPPDRERDAAAGPQHARDLAAPRAPGRREHQALAAEHDVVGARRAASIALEVEHARARRCRARARAPAPRRSPSSPARRRTARPRRRARRAGRGQPDAAGAAGELEHAVAGPRRAPARASRSVDARAARVDVVGVLAPRRRRPPPTCRGGARSSSVAVRLRCCSSRVLRHIRLLVTSNEFMR